MESAAKKNKQRNFLLILPLLIIPFLTMGFWALGGGKGDSAKSQITNKSVGLNLNLPSANIKEEKDLSKMSFYEKAKLDEEKSLEAMNADPYFKLPGTDSNALETYVQNSPTRFKPNTDYSGLNTSPIHSQGYTDPNEAKIMERLNQLQKEMNKPSQSNSTLNEYDVDNNDYKDNQDIGRLEQMMNIMKEKPDDDPEMKRLDGMLDKIMDIQHPERVKEEIKKKSVAQKENVFPVSRSSNESSVSMFSAKDTVGKGNRVDFYGIDESMKSDVEQNAIEAVIHTTQTLVNGSVVKFRILNDIYVNGSLIPKSEFLFGQASLDGERLKIEINSIHYGKSIFPVNMAVYDLDGLEGIYVPGAITRDVAKQSVDNGLQSMDLMTLNPSIAAQATASGISAAKSLLSKKAKLIKVTVKAGYYVLLKDKK
jgi:conjugative transposon TraM protein